MADEFSTDPVSAFYRKHVAQFSCDPCTVLSFLFALSFPVQFKISQQKSPIETRHNHRATVVSRENLQRSHPRRGIRNDGEQNFIYDFCNSMHRRVYATISL